MAVATTEGSTAMAGEYEYCAIWAGEDCQRGVATMLLVDWWIGYSIRKVKVWEDGCV